MESPIRGRILERLTQEPCISTSAVARLMDVDESTADYHLRRLRKEGRVISERQGRELCWAPAAMRLCPVLRRGIPLLRREEAARVAGTLEETPQTAGTVAARASLPLGTVRWIGTSLSNVGIAQRSLSGRLSLREGAETCVSKALEGRACDQWGTCPVSRALAPQTRKPATRSYAADEILASAARRRIGRRSDAD